MASETVSSDHPFSTPEPIEKEVCEEIKTMEQEGVSPPVESEEEPKHESSPGPEASQAELVEMMEEKQSEAPATEEVTITNEEEKPKAEDSPIVEEITRTDEEETPKPGNLHDEEVSSAGPEERDEHKQGEEALDVQKPDDTPLDQDASRKDNPQLVKEEISNVAEQAADNIESESKEQIEVKSSEKPTEVPSEKVNDEKKKEPEIDVPVSSVEAVEKEEENKEKSPDKEPEAAIAKNAETSGAGKVEARVLLPVEEEQSVAQPIITEGTGNESVATEPKEVEVEVAKDKETSTDKIEESTLMEEEATLTQSSDQVTSTNKDTAVEAKDIEGVVAEAAECIDTKEKQPIGFVEEPLKEKTEVENEAKEVKSEEKGEKIDEPAKPETTVKSEEDKTDESEALVQPEKIVETEEENGDKTEELTKPTSEVAADATSLEEKAVGGTNTSKDIETVAENWSRKDEDIPPTKTNKEDLVEKRVNEVSGATSGSVPLGKLLKPETESKEAQNKESVESKVEEEKASDDTAKPDDQSTESTKDADDNKISQDTSKEQVPAKTKQSNNILTKVKRSLVKAKRAIIGKSPNSKDTII